MKHTLSSITAPPAHSFSQQEFDQNIATALDRSLAVSEQLPKTDEDDEWETWDDATFELAAPRLATGTDGDASSGPSTSFVDSLDNIKPLNIHKKSGETAKTALCRAMP